MRNLQAVAMLAACLALAACSVSPLKAGKTEGMSPLQVKAQSIINEGYRLLAAVDREIGNSAADRIWSSSDAQKYLDQSIEYRKTVDGYQKLLTKGDVSAVLQQGDATNTIVDAFLKEIIAKAAAARKAKPTSWRDEPTFLSA